MQYRRYYLVLRRPANQPGLLTLAETARQAHLHPEILGRMVDLGLIDPAQTSPYGCAIVRHTDSPPN